MQNPDADRNRSGATGSGRSARRAPAWGFIVAVCVLLLASGLGFRFGGAGAENDGPVEKTELRKGFDEFPREFLGYVWRDDPLDPDVEEVAGAMYYLNLNGFRREDTAAAHLYVSYFGESRTLVEHEPQVCMKAGGWQLPYGIMRTKVQMPARDGGEAWELPVNAYLFKHDINYMFMVNYYVVNGEYMNRRVEARLAEEAERGFYAQARVSTAVSRSEAAKLRSERFRETEVFERLAEILRYVVPRLETHLPMDR